jgi:putative endonuclease
MIKEEKQWVVYILECQDNSLYTGITNDIEKRMKVHTMGKGSKYVASKKFKRLLHTIKAVDKIDAAKMEYKIKQLERNNKITFFINHPDRNFSVVNNQPI